MDIVNYAQTPGSQSVSGPTNAARASTKSCLLCRTLNHPLSWECYNCGWRGTVPFSAAAASSSSQRLFQTWLVFFRRCVVWFKENA